MVNKTYSFPISSPLHAVVNVTHVQLYESCVWRYTEVIFDSILCIGSIFVGHDCLNSLWVSIRKIRWSHHRLTLIIEISCLERWPLYRAGPLLYPSICQNTEMHNPSTSFARYCRNSSYCSRIQGDPKSNLFCMWTKYKAECSLEPSWITPLSTSRVSETCSSV